MVLRSDSWCFVLALLCVQQVVNGLCSVTRQEVKTWSLGLGLEFLLSFVV
uniref:Uncharacterized protein n=1 Tax=Anguilla anguilla TaxID=7936 RepID=A0A0E9XLJ3_ANGAN